MDPPPPPSYGVFYPAIGSVRPFSPPYVFESGVWCTWNIYIYIYCVPRDITFLFFLCFVSQVLKIVLGLTCFISITVVLILKTLNYFHLCCLKITGNIGSTSSRGRFFSSSLLFFVCLLLYRFFFMKKWACVWRCKAACHTCIHTHGGNTATLHQIINDWKLSSNIRVEWKAQKAEAAPFLAATFLSLRICHYSPRKAAFVFAEKPTNHWSSQLIRTARLHTRSFFSEVFFSTAFLRKKKQEHFSTKIFSAYEYLPTSCARAEMSHGFFVSGEIVVTNVELKINSLLFSSRVGLTPCETLKIRCFPRYVVTATVWLATRTIVRNIKISSSRYDDEQYSVSGTTHTCTRTR